MEWFRWYHGAISDPKWPLIARKSGQNIGTVVSIWAAMLEYASQAEKRGSIEGFDYEQIDALFGYEDGTTESVCNAMKRHVTDETGFIVSWSKRQTKRERDDSSTERVRAFRAKKKAQENEQDSTKKPNETPCNASVTPGNAQNRTEKRREEKKKNTLTATHPEYAEYVFSFQSRVEDLHGNIAPNVSDGLVNQSVDVIDKLIRIDGFSFDEIKSTMDWATGNDFWGKNALSIAALRKPLRDGTMKFKKIVADKSRLDLPRIGKGYDNQFAGVI